MSPGLDTSLINLEVKAGEALSTQRAHEQRTDWQ